MQNQGPSLLVSIKNKRRKTFDLNLRSKRAALSNAENAPCPSKNDLKDNDHDENDASGAVVDQRGTNHSYPTTNNQQQKKPRLKSAAVTTFYSHTSLKRLQHVEERVLRYLAHLRHRATTTTPFTRLSSIWKTFPTQQASFDFADQQDPSAEHLRVFSFECLRNGTTTTPTRRFLTTTYSEFWRRYSSMLPDHRHYYEIIRQGWPCHIYLDIEFSLKDNPDLDGNSSVILIIDLLKATLRDTFHVQVEDKGILELDSSTETKFSRHLIVRLPGVAFADNTHVGALIKEILESHGDENSSLLFARKKASAAANNSNNNNTASMTACIIDTGVYTKNRAFRIYLSSKLGKNATLLPTPTSGGPYHLSHEEIFMSSLVCNVSPESRILYHRSSSCDATRGAAKDTNVVVTAGTARSLSSSSSSSSSSPLHYRPSPHPELDAFIESVCSSTNAGSSSTGTIRSWTVLDDSGSIFLYNIKGNRFCGNIGRQHKSNGIFFIVDVQHGVWYQKCYDPECRHYKSPATALPLDVLHAVQQKRQSEHDHQDQTEGDARLWGGGWGAEEEGEGEVAWEVAALDALQQQNLSSS